jgi:hypothetical protein
MLRLVMGGLVSSESPFYRANCAVVSKSRHRLTLVINVRRGRWTLRTYRKYMTPVSVGI